MSQLVTVMDIFKLLKKNNCMDCHEKTCLAFAASVLKGHRQLNECPHVDREVLQQVNGKIERPKTIEDDQEKIVQALKQEVSKIDLQAIAWKAMGIYENSRLTLRVLGKNFSVGSNGNLYTDIHVNPWVTIPLLSYILHCSDIPLSGKWVSFRELKQGKMWEGLFGQQCEIPLKRLADTHTDLFETLIEVFNGKKIENHYQSDISLVLYPLPKVPILICYWKPDDNMDSELHLFFDSSSIYNINIEGIYALGTGLVRMFEKIVLRHGIP